VTSHDFEDVIYLTDNATNIVNLSKKADVYIKSIWRKSIVPSVRIAIPTCSHW